MKKVPVYILSGGKSSRFGTDKARADYNGSPLLKHVADSYAPVADSITVVADREGKYNDLGLRTIEDIHKGLGPLGGLHAAANDLGEGWFMLASCDFAGIRREWLELIISKAVDSIKAVAFRAEIWEPMPALYHTFVRDITEDVIKKKGAIWHVFERVETASLSHPDNWGNAVNINTQKDFSKFANKRK